MKTTQVRQTETAERLPTAPSYERWRDGAWSPVLVSELGDGDLFRVVVSGEAGEPYRACGDAYRDEPFSDVVVEAASVSRREAWEAGCGPRPEHVALVVDPEGRLVATLEVAVACSLAFLVTDPDDPGMMQLRTARTVYFPDPSGRPGIVQLGDDVPGGAWIVSHGSPGVADRPYMPVEFDRAIVPARADRPATWLSSQAPGLHRVLLARLGEPCQLVELLDRDPSPAAVVVADGKLLGPVGSAAILGARAEGGRLEFLGLLSDAKGAPFGDPAASSRVKPRWVVVVERGLQVTDDELREAALVELDLPPGPLNVARVMPGGMLGFPPDDESVVGVLVEADIGPSPWWSEVIAPFVDGSGRRPVELTTDNPGALASLCRGCAVEARSIAGSSLWKVEHGLGCPRFVSGSVP